MMMSSSERSSTRRIALADRGWASCSPSLGRALLRQSAAGPIEDCRCSGEVEA